MGGQRILFVSENAEAAPTRYRAMAFFEQLRRAGWEPAHQQVTGLWRRVALLHAARDARVVVVLRKAFSPALCSLLRTRGRRLVFDIDDALFAQDDGTVPRTIRRRFDAMAANVDMIWAGNSHLARQAPAKTSAIVLPTSVEPALYDRPPSAPTDNFDIVWIGSSSTRKYLESLLPTLAQAATLLPALRLKIIADFDLPNAGIRTVPIRWSAATEAAALRSAHVGIAPLPDDPWTRGKCGLKIIQCMAAGLPVIASPVGVQSEMVVTGQTGFLAGNPDGWLSALQRLHADAALRKALGDAGRQRVLEHYCVTVTFEKMLSALRQLAPE